MRHAIPLFFLILFFSMETSHARRLIQQLIKREQLPCNWQDLRMTRARSNSACAALRMNIPAKQRSSARPRTEIKNKKAQWILEHMPYGSYSIKVFHDENGNSKLDKDILGVPTERYGFSNNARGRFGPPPFQQRCLYAQCSADNNSNRG